MTAIELIVVVASATIAILTVTGTACYVLWYKRLLCCCPRAAAVGPGSRRKALTAASAGSQPGNAAKTTSRQHPPRRLRDDRSDDDDDEEGGQRMLTFGSDGAAGAPSAAVDLGPSGQTADMTSASSVVSAPSGTAGGSQHSQGPAPVLPTSVGAGLLMPRGAAANNLRPTSPPIQRAATLSSASAILPSAAAAANHEAERLRPSVANLHRLPPGGYGPTIPPPPLRQHPNPYPPQQQHVSGGFTRSSARQPPPVQPSYVVHQHSALSYGSPGGGGGTHNAAGPSRRGPQASPPLQHHHGRPFASASEHLLAEEEDAQEEDEDRRVAAFMHRGGVAGGDPPRFYHGGGEVGESYGYDDGRATTGNYRSSGHLPPFDPSTRASRRGEGSLQLGDAYYNEHHHHHHHHHAYSQSYIPPSHADNDADEDNDDRGTGASRLTDWQQQPQQPPQYRGANRGGETAVPYGANSDGRGISFYQQHHLNGPGGGGGGAAVASYHYQPGSRRDVTSSPIQPRQPRQPSPRHAEHAQYMQHQQYEQPPPRYHEGDEAAYDPLGGDLPADDAQDHHGRQDLPVGPAVIAGGGAGATTTTSGSYFPQAAYSQQHGVGWITLHGGGEAQGMGRAACCGRTPPPVAAAAAHRPRLRYASPSFRCPESPACHLFRKFAKWRAAHVT